MHVSFTYLILTLPYVLRTNLLSPFYKLGNRHKTDIKCDFGYRWARQNPTKFLIQNLYFLSFLLYSEQQTSFRLLMKCIPYSPEGSPILNRLLHKDKDQVNVRLTYQSVAIIKCTLLTCKEKSVVCPALVFT